MLRSVPLSCFRNSTTLRLSKIDARQLASPYRLTKSLTLSLAAGGSNGFFGDPHMPWSKNTKNSRRTICNVSESCYPTCPKIVLDEGHGLRLSHSSSHGRGVGQGMPGRGRSDVTLGLHVVVANFLSLAWLQPFKSARTRSIPAPVSFCLTSATSQHARCPFSGFPRCCYQFHTN